MQNKFTVTLMLCCILGLSGCTTTKDVLFVTKTSLGIDIDAKPATASIGYDRTEGYIAPRYDNGEIPPVVASIKSDGGIFNPKIRQVYATGDAAVIAVSDFSEAALNNLDPGAAEGKAEKKLSGKKQLMFFGTTTTTGLKVGFTSYVPDSFSFGFKRKEYSFIPLGNVVKREPDGKVTEEYDVYPSVLASIDTAANAGTANKKGAPSGDTSLSNSQFFATGRAARVLAASDGVKAAFTALATESLLAEKQTKKVSIEDEKIKKIVAHYTDTEGKLNKIDLDKKVSDLIKEKKITDKSAGEMLKGKVDTVTKLSDMLKGDFDGLGQPLCDSLIEQCK